MDVFEFADDTNITYNIDIELNIADIGDVEALSRQLKMYGLDLKAEVREQEVFVLSGRLKGL